ncbi:MAG: DMT family transporter, partial [Acidobacteria bacterium]|nr:DMT family transporter [Acidobacteriota bacterium]
MIPGASTSYSSPEPVQPRRSALRGYLAIAGAAVLWGASAALGRAVFTGRLLGNSGLKPLDPLILAQARVTFSVLLLAPLLVTFRGTRPFRIARKEILAFALLGVLGLAGSNYSYYLAIEKTTVATAIILQYTAPVWVLIYMVARGLQRATPRRSLAVAAAVCGCALAIGVGGPAHIRLNVVGVLAAFGAAFTFAFYNVFGHSILRRHDRWTTLTYALAAAAVFWLMVNPPWKVASAHYSGAQWLFLLVFALLSALIPFALYFTGLQHLDATR